MQEQLEVGTTLRDAVRIYRDQAGVLLPLAFWLFLGVAIVSVWTQNSFALSWVGVIFSLIVTALYEGIVVGLVRDLRDGRRDSSVRDLIRLVLPVLGPLLGASILYGLGVGAGFVLLLIPGLYLATIWAVAAPVIVIERCGVFDAFGRSRHLVSENGWRVLGVIGIAFLIGAVVAAGFLLIEIRFADEPLIRILATTISSTLTAPITALVVSVLYFRLLEIKGQQAPAPPSVPQQPGDGIG